jgi:archaemetzincin
LASAPPPAPRRRLEIVPAGGVSVDVLAEIGRAVDARLGTEHHVAGPLAVLPAWREGDALLSAAVLDALLARAAADGSAEDGGLFLAVTDAELRAPEAGRVFGEAAVGGACAVIGLGSLCAAGDCDESTCLDRAVKEAVHELGHAAGLPHCADPVCVMYPSLHIADTDRKAAAFCARCESDYSHATLDAARG